jgi:hypothetical protein
MSPYSATLWAGFALSSGCDEVDAVFVLGLFGFPWSRISSLSSLSFFSSDPSCQGTPVAYPPVTGQGRLNGCGSAKAG